MNGQRPLSPFRPAWGLGNRHIQSVLGGFPPAWPPRVVRERWELPDGDFIDVDWLRPEGESWALVLPGITGGLTSAYALRLLRRLAKAGLRAGLVNYRGRSGSPNRLPGSYHAGFTQDLDTLTRILATRHGPGLVAAYSMGANLLLKWLGELESAAPVRAAAAASVPFQLDATAEHLRTGSGRAYERFLMRGLRRHVHRKADVVSGLIPLPLVRQLRSIRDFDERITAPLHGFSDAADYYAKASCWRWLSKITVPTLVVHAWDDPLVPAATIPPKDALSPSVTLEVTDHGGHVGFLGRGSLGRPRFWLAERLASHLLGCRGAGDLHKQGLGEERDEKQRQQVAPASDP